MDLSSVFKVFDTKPCLRIGTAFADAENRDVPPNGWQASAPRAPGDYHGLKTRGKIQAPQNENMFYTQ